MRTFAVVPAAGRSTRMGRPKLALPVGGRSLIERVVAALRDGGVDRVLVVTAPHTRDVATLACTAGAEVLSLTAPTTDMRETVERGLAHLEDRYRPSSEEWWLLAPADHPAVSGDAVRGLLGAVRSATGSIMVPTCRGRRGHPVAMRWRLVRPLRLHPPDRGIDDFLRARPNETHEWPTADVGLVTDIDTPGDYQRFGGVTPD